MDIARSIAYLGFRGEEFEVIKLEGLERLNQPYFFKLSIRAPSATDDYVEAIGEPIKLSLQTDLNKIRSWSGYIKSIESQQYTGSQLLTLEMHHTLERLTQCQKVRQFYQKDLLSVACQLLTEHGISYHLADIDSFNYQPQPYIYQHQALSDFDFFRQLIGRAKLQFWLSEQGVHLFKNIASANYSPYQALSYLENSQHNTLANNSFTEFSLSQQGLELSSSLKHLTAGERLELHFDKAQGIAKDYLILSVNHRYDRQKHHLYESTAHLSEHLEFDELDIEPELYLGELATIVGNKQQAQLDTQGAYQYQLQSNQLDNKEQFNYQPPITRMSPFAGSGAKGLHFPLKHGDEILLGYLDGKAEQPFILSSFFAKHQLMTKSYQNIFSSSELLQFKCSDQLKQESITLKAGDNSLDMGVYKTKPQVSLQSSGSIYCQAETNFILSMASFDLNVANNAIYQATQKVQFEVGGNYHQTAEQDISFYGQEFNTLTSLLWLAKAESIDWLCQKQCLGQSLNDDILMSCPDGEIIIEAEQIIIEGEQCELGTEQAKLNLIEERIELQADNMVVDSQDGVTYRGKINYVSR